VTFHDARGRTIEREITAPAEGAARVRLIALLAGNLARNEADDLAMPPASGASTGADPANATDAPAPCPAACAVAPESRSTVSAQVAPGDELSVRVTPKQAACAEAAPPPSPSTRVPRAQSDGSTQRTLGWIAVGSGVVAAGTGVVLRLLATSDTNRAAEVCVAAQCTASGLAAAHSANEKTVLSNVSLAVGAALGATGVILELTAPSLSSSTSVALSPQGVLVSGRW
jgi:hypothetical protein